MLCRPWPTRGGLVSLPAPGLLTTPAAPGSKGFDLNGGGNAKRKKRRSREQVPQAQRERADAIPMEH